MRSISDIIEEFILQQLSLEDEINLSRNELAVFFNCAPSQINYVLSTRFTPIRGFDIESRRGGGGFIKIYKLNSSSEYEYLQTLLNNVIGEEIDYNTGLQLLENLKLRLFIEDGEYNIIKSVISPKSLANPIKMEDKLRAKILKNVLLEKLKGG